MTPLCADTAKASSRSTKAGGRANTFPCRPPSSVPPTGSSAAGKGSASGEKDVPSDVILPRDLMENIAESGPQNADELRELMKDCPVRFSLFGDEILNISRSVPCEDENQSRER